MEWTSSLREAIDYMERNLMQNIGACDVAEAVHMSSYYFQKGFKVMTGYTVGEYIRNRRLYLAALDIISGEDRMIELAYKYGYGTPEGFAKAFYRFHGVTPGRVRGNAAAICTFLPLRISIDIKGGHDMDYVIEKLAAIRFIGFEREFSYESAYGEIPKFWDEFSAKRCHDTGDGKNSDLVVKTAAECRVGEYGICIDDIPDTGKFRYMIAGIYNGGKVPAGMRLCEIPAYEWARFRCAGPLPGALQAVNTAIYREWLPGNTQYEIADGIDVEYYPQGDMTAADYVSEIWIPINRK